jgi:hypothetical protein
MPLTDRTVRTRPPGRHHDGKGTGLILLVREMGARLWVQRLRVNGKVRELGHGRFPAVSLADARRAAEAAKRAADAGGDPVADRRARKAQPAGTLSDALAGYLDAHGPAWRSPKTARLVRSSLERHT